MMQTVPSLKAFIVVQALRRINTFAAVIWATSKPADEASRHEALCTQKAAVSDGWVS